MSSETAGGAPVNSDSQLIAVRHESGKFMVSHLASKLSVEATTLDSAYARLNELLLAHNASSANQKAGWIPADGEGNWLWVGGMEHKAIKYRAMLAIKTIYGLWVGGMEHKAIKYWAVLAIKTIYVALIGTGAIAFIAVAAFIVFRPHFESQLRARFSPAAVAQKLDSMPPHLRAHYRENLEVIVKFLTPYAPVFRPLLQEALPPEDVTGGSGSPESATGEKGQKDSPMRLARPPKPRTEPD